MFFQDKINNEHQLYATIRDKQSNICKSKKEIIENLWKIYQPYAPEGFLDIAQIDFYQRWWEMYCGVGLLNIGIKFDTNNKDEGPDFKIETDTNILWIEACCPTPGKGQDRLPDCEREGGYEIPEQQFLLRITSAISDKKTIYEEYVQKGIINDKNNFIIAISSAELNTFGTFMNFPCPAPLKVLSGAGCLVLSKNGNYCSLRNGIAKVSGSPVDTKLFYTDEYKNISGILYSYHDPWCEMSENPEISFQLFINPQANNPFENELFNSIEIWKESKKDGDKIIWEKSTNR